MKQRVALLKEMKDSLLAKRKELTDLLGKLDEAEPEGQVKDTADEASSLTLNKLKSSLQETEISEIKLIDEALERIEQGEYGICTSCNEPINSKRLAIFPYAARCISCQESLEE